MKGCKTCKWATWQMTSNGRINRHYAGDCHYVPAIPPLPDSITKAYGYQVGFSKSKIHVEMGRECPTYEEKQK